MIEPVFTREDIKILDSYAISRPFNSTRLRYANFYSAGFRIIVVPIADGYAVQISRLDFSASYSERGKDLDSLIRNAMMHCRDDMERCGFLASAVTTELNYWKKCGRDVKP